MSKDEVKNHEKEEQVEDKSAATEPVNDQATDTESSIEELLEENEKLKDEVNRKNDQLLRKVAEFENLRKRTQRERIQLFDDAKINAIKELLPVYDDLERSIGNLPEDSSSSFSDGIKLVYNKFGNVLNQMGIEAINETEVPFDVDLHDALLKQPASDEKTESNTVLQVLETGYRIGEKVIRHAKVIVSE